MTTWRKLIAYAMENANDAGPLLFVVVAPVEDCVIGAPRVATDEDLDREFDNGWGSAEGFPFTAWTESRVYFPKEYDGAESVGSAFRNPCMSATNHV